MAGSNVSAVTNLLPKVNEGFISTLGSTISSGAGSVPLTDITGLTNGSVFVGIIEPSNAKEQVFTGIVDTNGSQITNVKWTRGTNVSHSGGVTIVDYITGTVVNMITKWAAIQHNTDGSHSAITAISAAISGALTAGSLSTAGNLAAASVTASGNISGVDLTYSGWAKPVATVTANPGSLTPATSTQVVTGLAQTLTINAPSGTPDNGQSLLFRIKDNGTARTLTWNAIYRAIGITVPTTTTASKTMYVQAIYNATDSKWDVVSVSREA